MSVSYSMGKSASFFSDPSPLVLRAVPSGGSADEKPPQGGLCCVEIHTLPSLPSVGSQSRELGYLGTCLICCCHMCLLCYQEAENLVATVVPTHLAAAVPEVAVYLKESVGNSTRIDYGTGTCDLRRCLPGFTVVLSWTASSLLWVVWNEGALSREP